MLNRQEWCEIAKLLYESDSLLALAIIQDYLLLTICFNLELVDLCLQEVEVLRNLCAVYLQDAFIFSLMPLKRNRSMSESDGSGIFCSTFRTAKNY